MHSKTAFLILMLLAGLTSASGAGGDREKSGKAGQGVLRVAAVSPVCVHGDPAANLKHHALWTERAVAQGARFVGFPECSITGYDFSPEVGISVEGAEVRAIVELAKKHSIYLSAGLVEKRAGKRHSTQILAGPGGSLDVMRKVNLTTTERRHFTPGAEFPVFDVDGVKVSIAICADATQYETLHVFALRGAQMIFAPHANTLKGTPQSWFDFRIGRWEWFAKDCAVYIVGCNNAGRFEAPRENELSMRFTSGALVIGPDGKVVGRSQPTTNVETMIVVDVSTVDIEKKRAGLFSFKQLEMERFYGELVKDSPYVKWPGKPP